MSYTTAIILAGTSVLGACSGMVGSFAVLRRRALLGDALAHAALPGVCLAFLLIGHRHLPAMLLGAFLTGVGGIVVVTALRFATRIKEDAAIGIVLSVFFGAGVVLLRIIINNTSTGGKAGLQTYIYGNTTSISSQDVTIIGGVSAFCLLLVVCLYKEFKVVAFDSGFAGVQGWPSFWLDLLLMTMVAVTVVIGLPAVGVVMMAALLIIPAAAARFWTERLGVMLLLAAVLGMVMGAVGTLASSEYAALPAGPSIVLAGAALFLVSMLLAPRRGLVSRMWSEHRFRIRIAEQKLLEALYALHEEESEARPFSIDQLLQRKSWTRRQVERGLGRLRSAGFLTRDGGRYRLTEGGLRRAARAARAARLWEMYLSDYADRAAAVADLDRETFREHLPPAIVRELESKLRSEGRLPRV